MEGQKKMQDGILIIREDGMELEWKTGRVESWELMGTWT